MKNGMKIVAAILVVVMAAALICTAIELNKTKAKLLEATVRNELLQAENTMNKVENIRLGIELAEAKATGKKWVPEWIGKGIVKPIEPKTRLEVLK